MAQHWTCPHGHRWESAVAGPLPGQPNALCPNCGARGQSAPDTPAARGQFDETLAPPPPASAENALDETLDPSLLPAEPAAARATSGTGRSPTVPEETLDKPTVPEPFDETLDKPTVPEPFDETLDKPTVPDPFDVTLDGPSPKATGQAHYPAGGPSGPHGRSTRERPQAHDQTLDAPQYHTAPAVPSSTGEEYEILGELGRGGMGMVYKALQVRLNRLVALKMIRAGIHADPMDLLRFQREAEAVAQLRHESIVQIYEVGDRNGMPFFSLEYVEGGSLQKKLDGTPQPPKQTAALIEILARAMDFAHKRGIIHRDLKPANILLTADGAPKITDFGLAKRLEEADSGQTGTGAILGTPTYMSPEQAQGKNRLIGPPADIYALGAVLYDLLTGRPPFKGETIMDTLHLLQNTEPVPPTRLQPKVPRDLETICLKCLQKDPARRYGSALELAEDLNRFLNNRPIKARKTSTAERVYKWARRHPAVAALYGVSAFALLALGTGGWLLAQSETARAFTAETLKQEADTARDVAVKEQQRAETNLYLAFESGDQLFLLISQEALLNQPAMEKVRRELLLRSLAFYQRFLSENPSNRNVLYDLGRAQRRVAGIYEKLDDPREALTHYGEAEKIFERLAKENPDRDEYRQDEARTRIDRAIVLHLLERYDEAEQEHDRAVPLLTGLIAGAGDVPEYRGDLAASHISRAALLQWRQRNDDAIRYYKLAAELLEGLHQQDAGNDDVRVKLAGAYNNLGILIHPADRAAAMKHYARALALVTPEPKDAAALAGYQRERARAHLNQGVGHRQEKDYKTAENEYETADAILHQLIAMYPYTAEYQQLRAATQKNLGELFLALRQPEKERAADELAYALLKPLHQKNPDNAAYAADLARAATELGFALGPTREPKRVLELWGEAESLWQGLAKNHAKEGPYRVALGKCLLNKGQLYGRDGQAANALREYGKAVAVYEAVARDLPAEKGYLADWVAAYDNQARTFAFLAKGPEAEAAWKKAADLGKKWSEDAPSAAAHVAHANPLIAWGQDRINRGNVASGCALLERALAARYAVAALEPGRLDRRLDWHKLALLILQNRAAEKEPAKVVQIATAWLADWQRLKPLPGEDPQGAYSFRAAELVGKGMRAVAQEKRAKEFGDLTMRLLERAVRAGYRDRAALEGSVDLQGVRDRPDFAALLKKLASAPSTAP